MNSLTISQCSPQFELVGENLMAPPDCHGDTKKHFLLHISSFTFSARWLLLVNCNPLSAAAVAAIFSCSRLLCWFVWRTAFDSLIVPRVVSDFLKKLCKLCCHDALPLLREFLGTIFLLPEPRFIPPVLLLSPLDMYALIKAWNQVKLSPPLLDFLVLTFGDMNTKKVKRPWRGVRQVRTIPAA